MGKGREEGSKGKEEEVLAVWLCTVQIDYFIFIEPH